MKEDLDRPLPLRRAVEEALAIFGQGFVSHPDNGALRAVLVDGSLGGKELFNQLVRLVYRVIFLLTVEDRELLHLESTSVAARKRYREGYRIGRLRDPREHNGIWESIKRVFRGVGTGDARLGLPGLAGIFKADRCPALDAAALDDRSARLAFASAARAAFSSRLRSEAARRCAVSSDASDSRAAVSSTAHASAASRFACASAMRFTSACARARLRWRGISAARPAMRHASARGRTVAPPQPLRARLPPWLGWPRWRLQSPMRRRRRARLRLLRRAAWRRQPATPRLREAAALSPRGSA